MLIFLVGTMLILVAPTLPIFLLGRAIQGIGTAGFVPLSIAIITQWFPIDARGRILGTWNSVIPLTGLSVPYFAGLLVDNFGWRAIFPPILIVGLVALFIVRTNIPTLGARQVDPAFLRSFDWLGVLLLSSALAFLLLYTSSRPITGIDGLRDWRLLTICLGLFILLYFWERRFGQKANRSTETSSVRQPYIKFAIFANRTFTAASFSAGLRMFLMSSISFLLPLYLTDVHDLNASTIGIALALQAGMLFIISRAGGQLADRWGSQRPILLSMGGLVVIMLSFANLPATTPLWVIFALSATHGLTIGLSLAPLHRASIQGVATEETGSAAGLYSMIRFAGQIIGVAVAGVTLQQGLATAGTAIAAYQLVFWLYVGVAVVATVVSLGVNEG